VLVLAFDTSTPAVTVAILEYDEVPLEPPADAKPGGPRVVSIGPRRTLTERTEIATNRHGELLTPMIRSVLNEAGAAVRDLTAIGVGLGPGPFTGLRVGVMTAKAISDAVNVPVYGLSSLDAIAHAHYAGGGLAVLTDARRKQVYWALYDEHEVRIDGPEIGHPADVATALRGRVRNVVGAGALLYPGAFGEFTVWDHDQYPQAAQLVWMVAMRRFLQPVGEDLTPLYLRRPDAQPPGKPKLVTPV
jgi:tRNA threonylcarbamoyl adenosine modification protein YeaZ